MNGLLTLLCKDVKVPTIQRELFRLKSFGAIGIRHRLSSKVSGRLRKVTHRKTVWLKRWVWSESQRHLYTISALHYRPKITSIVLTDNYENFSTRSRLHSPTVGIHERTRSCRHISEPALRAYKRIRAHCLRLQANPRPGCSRLRASPRSIFALASEMRAPRFSSSSANLPRSVFELISEPPVHAAAARLHRGSAFIGLGLVGV